MEQTTHTGRQRGDYRRKLENRLQQNNMREVWSGLKTITGHGKMDFAPPVPSPLTPTRPFPLPHAPPLLPCTTSQPSCPPLGFSPPSLVTFTAEDVRREFSRLHPRKAAGPDGLSPSPRALKGCASQLCGIFQHIFNLSLIQNVVPDLWKTSCLVPMPKKKHPSTHSDYTDQWP
ncbi:hypothetical protein L3Q82_007310 [Scortum barcoo]|uniref:Uncharacterized protein n=1 Tax=Scortum barcoo TaxID=214431 RepID=A0ACB8WSL0_9TELE|nr:hypothetical protein L3Q82_007310 [Scortum barcoo]